jgi:hypothetical protein
VVGRGVAGFTKVDVELEGGFEAVTGTGSDVGTCVVVIRKMSQFQFRYRLLCLTNTS